MLTTLIAVAIVTINPHLTQGTALEYAQHFIDAGEATGEDPLLLVAVAGYESHYRTDTRSHAGYCGLMQCPSRKKGTWRRAKPTCDYWKIHPAENVMYGAEELAGYRETWPDTADVLCRYSLGPRKVCPKKSQRTYVRGVLWMYDMVQRIVSDNPHGHYWCHLTVTVDGQTIEHVDIRPVWGGDGSWSGRRYIRDYRDGVLSRLQRASKIDLCDQTFGPDTPEAKHCTHSPRQYDCHYEESHEDHDDKAYAGFGIGGFWSHVDAMGCPVHARRWRALWPV